MFSDALVLFYFSVSLFVFVWLVSVIRLFFLFITFRSVGFLFRPRLGLFRSCGLCVYSFFLLLRFPLFFFVLFHWSFVLFFALLRFSNVLVNARLSVCSFLVLSLLVLDFVSICYCYLLVPFGYCLIIVWFSVCSFLLCFCDSVGFFVFRLRLALLFLFFLLFVCSFLVFVCYCFVLFLLFCFGPFWFSVVIVCYWLVLRLFFFWSRCVVLLYFSVFFRSCWFCFVIISFFFVLVWFFSVFSCFALCSVLFGTFSLFVFFSFGSRRLFFHAFCSFRVSCWCCLVLFFVLFCYSVVIRLFVVFFFFFVFLCSPLFGCYLFVMRVFSFVVF